MKYYGKIEDNNDLVNKKYVDDNSGSIPNDGKLKIQVDEETPVEVFSANKSTDSTIEFKAGTGISLEQNSTGGITITNTNSGGSPITPGNGKLQITNDSGENPVDLFTANQSTDSILNFIGTNGINVSTSTLDNKGTNITISGSGTSAGNGALNIQVNSSDTLSLFTANQSTDSILNFIGTNGITVSKTNANRSTNITISGSGEGSGNSYYKYSQNTTTSTLLIPTSYKNVVVKFYYNNISIPGSGGISYTLNFTNRLNEGNEMYIYLRNVGDTAGVNIQVPTSLSFSESSSLGGEESTYTYPVIYNGYYTSVSSYFNETINLIYSTSNKDISTVYTALVLHVLFDGEVYYINKLQYTLPNN